MKSKIATAFNHDAGEFRLPKISPNSDGWYASIQVNNDLAITLMLENVYIITILSLLGPWGGGLFSSGPFEGEGGSFFIFGKII